jgi:hypothetical protein
MTSVFLSYEENAWSSALVFFHPTALITELREDKLNEDIPMPTWMSLRRAVCSSISVAIPWTQLKRMPVRVVFFLYIKTSLSQVVDSLEVDLAFDFENLRPPPKQPKPEPTEQKKETKDSGETVKYSFLDAVTPPSPPPHTRLSMGSWSPSTAWLCASHSTIMSLSCRVGRSSSAACLRSGRCLRSYHT